MLAIALLLPVPGDPVVPGSALKVEAQWAAILACPRISVLDKEGTGTVIGVRDGFVYLLTADHVLPYNAVEVMFTSPKTYPKWDPTRVAESPEVVGRWPDADLALIRFKEPDKWPVSQLPLAGPGQRPKTFPFPVWTVGLSDKAVTVRVDRVGAKRAIRPPNRALGFYWETDNPPERGRSGGPLLDDRGRVIGLCEAFRGDHGYYTHLDEILAALKRDGYGWLVTPKP